MTEFAIFKNISGSREIVEVVWRGKRFADVRGASGQVWRTTSRRVGWTFPTKQDAEKELRSLNADTIEYVRRKISRA